MLERHMENRAPTIFKLIKFGNFEDSRFETIVNSFSSYDHVHCSIHGSTCLDHAAASMVTLYRSIKCHQSMISALAELIPNFSESTLQVHGAKARYASALSSSYWMHAPVNAVRVFREEVLGRYVGAIIPNFSIETCTYLSSRIYAEFILQDDDILPPVSDGQWPMTRRLDECITRIWRIETNRINRESYAKERMHMMGLVYYESNPSLTEWVYNVNLSLLNLDQILVKILKKNIQAARYCILSSGILDSKVYQRCFFCVTDQKLFEQTAQFKFGVFSSCLARDYMNGKNCTLEKAIRDCSEIIEKMIKGSIDPTVILTLIPLFNFD